MQEKSGNLGKGFVIYSPNESSLSKDEAGFWSNEHGWTDLEGATVYKDKNNPLPMSTGNDATWMENPGKE